jgi:glycosyltransferase involved in cell wall biosynthesis
LHEGATRGGRQVRVPRRPETGKFIVIQPWEYGHLPRAWVEAATQEADEVWIHSRFVRDPYVRSGVPAEKVRIIPLDFNPAIFRPDGPQAALATTKSVRFLFGAGALDRKGADLLLEAYLCAFSADDDVCLIVKDVATRTFYEGQTFATAFREAQRRAGAPEILYRDDDLTDAELAALYRSGTCFVLPYRAEGFAMPPLEAMACGLPVIVTAGGVTS